MRCKTTLGPTEWGTKGKTYPNLCLFCWNVTNKKGTGGNFNLLLLLFNQCSVAQGVKEIIFAEVVE